MIDVNIPVSVKMCPLSEFSSLISSIVFSMEQILARSMLKVVE